MLELLMPAGNLKKLKTAFHFGADAVYLGGKAFSLRAFADNFSEDELVEAANYAHALGKKVYVTVNIFAKNQDLDKAKEYFEFLQSAKVDAVLISDIGLVTLCKQVAPNLVIHLSTQANTTNLLAVKFWQAMGVKRVVLARELSLDEVLEIHNAAPDMELEAFVHGAMCISYSGRCLLSSFFTGRDANQGACTHPCRWKYAVMEEKRPGEYFPVYENDRGTYIFNSKDLCMIEHIPEMIKAGIDSFKIEGRMKTALYVATVARTYRKAIDDYLESEEKYRANMEWYKAEIAKCTYRQFTTCFYFGKPDENTQIYDSNTYVNEYIYLGIVEEVKSYVEDTAEPGKKYSTVKIEQRNKFCVGDEIEIMKPDGRNVGVKVLSMKTQEGEVVESAPHPQQILYVELSGQANQFDLLRVQETK